MVNALDYQSRDRSFDSRFFGLSDETLLDVEPKVTHSLNHFHISLLFMPPRHKIAERHIEFTLCVCVPDSCPTHNFIVHGGI